MRMTVNEIKEFVQTLRHRVDIFVYRGWAIDGLINDYTKSADTIEKLLEEVQEYREIGTVEEIQSMKENGAFSGIELAQIAAMQMKLKEYKSIGTIEQFKTLKEKNEPKKVDEDYCCPICHTCGMDDDGIKGTYCTDCGKKLDWQ